MKINLKRLTETAMIPTRRHGGGACVINPGDRIAQLVVMPYLDVELI